MKSESFPSLHWHLHNYHFDASKRHLKTNPYELSGLVQIFWRDSITLYDEQSEFRLLFTCNKESGEQKPCYLVGPPQIYEGVQNKTCLSHVKSKNVSRKRQKVTTNSQTVKLTKSFSELQLRHKDTLKWSW